MKQKVAPYYFRAQFDGNSFNEEDCTVDVVFATEIQAKRNGWDGPYIEILDCSPKSVMLERLNSGAPVLDNHDGSSVLKQLGVVVKATIANKEGRATLRFSKRESLKELRDDIKDGIVRNVSVGYFIHEYTQTEGTANSLPIFRATLWEGFEISMAPVPVDFGSGVRSQENTNFNEVEIISKISTMEEPIVAPGAEPVAQTRSVTPEPAPAAAPAAAAPNVVNEENIRSLERTRINFIQNAARAVNFDDETFIRGLIDNGSTAEAASRAIIDKMAESQPVVRGTSNARVTGNDEGDQIRTALENVLMHRHDSSMAAITTDKDKAYRHVTLMDAGRILLQSRGERISFDMSANEIAHRAMAIGDYPLLLANVVNKALRNYYAAAPTNWKQFARKRDAANFKAMYSVQFGGSFLLEEKKEGGEYKNATFAETGDNFKLKTWGKRIGITREMIINDDLGGFMRYTSMFGRGAAQTEANVVWGLITMNSGAGRTLADGYNLFDATNHGNAASAGAAMSLTTLNAARVAMTRQTGLNGEPILITPKFLVVPPELELLAKQLVHSTIVATKTSDTNPLLNAFEIISDVYLTDQYRWYVFADPYTTDVVEYAYLNGQEGLYTEQHLDFKTDELEIKVRSDFNASIFESRGVYTNAGH